MAREPKYGGTFNGWQRLDKKLEAYMADFPHLEAPRLRFRELIGLGLELMAQQTFHIAGKQESTQRLQELIADGRKLATFLRTGVKQHYGNRSEKIVAYGLQPFRSKPRTRRVGPDGKPLKRKGKAANAETPAAPEIE